MTHSSTPKGGLKAAAPGKSAVAVAWLSAEQGIFYNETVNKFTRFAQLAGTRVSTLLATR